MEKKSQLEIIDELVNFYCTESEIRHLGILCRKASYKNEEVLNYIRDLQTKYM